MTKTKANRVRNKLEGKAATRRNRRKRYRKALLGVLPHHTRGQRRKNAAKHKKVIDQGLT